MAEGGSYWTRRRKIKKRVAEHLEYISKAKASKVIYNHNSDAAEGEEQPDNNELCEIKLDELECVEGEETDLENFNEVCDLLPLVGLGNEFSDDSTMTDSSSGDDSCISNHKDDPTGSSNYLSAQLAHWAKNFQVPHNAVNNLLQLLRVHHPDLPKDTRTLLKTPRHCDVKEIAEGSYHYFGVETSLVKILLPKVDSLKEADQISLQCNVDGIPLFKSSNVQFWPILGKVKQPFTSDPFTIALFCGTKKPTCIAQYLGDFVQEMEQLHENGIEVNGYDKKLKVHVSAFICDAPARAFLKQVKGHNSYYGCERCCQKGEWLGRVTFPSLTADPRTDETYDSDMVMLGRL